MNILIDENIPYAKEIFSLLGNVKTIPGRLISSDHLNNIDAIMVRSVTKVNETLLKGKPIRFVGTATAGTDHINKEWIKKMGIGFSAAPGCNTISVTEYIFSVLLTFAERDNFLLKDKIVGIVGVGNIGKCLQERLEILGIQTLLCDPPRVAQGDKGDFYTLDELIKKVDILTLHTPLIKDGYHKTLHLLDEKLISKLKPGTILINSCRGAVIDNTALLSRLKAGQDLKVALDVWESEPNLNIELLNFIDIGTAHIAGYALESKVRGTIKLFESYSSFIGQSKKIKLDLLLPIPEFHSITIHGSLNQSIIKRLVHLIYDVRRDDVALRKTGTILGGFDNLRKNYIDRREWSSLNVICDDAKTASILKKLGFNAFHHPSINVFNKL